MSEEALQQIRLQIDTLDEQIQTLINERGKLALQVAEIKKQQGNDAVYYRPEREAQILRKVLERNKGPLQDKEILLIFREILAAGLALQQPLHIAFLGPAGTFSHIAALKHFGRSFQPIAKETIPDVFRSVENKAAQYGIVPIENSTEGIVAITLDCFIDSSLKICSEVELPIHHCLLAKSTATPIKTVYSHSQSLAQCRTWLAKNLPEAACIAVSSNAYAAKLAAENGESAAIASELCAEIYGLKVQEQNIQDSSQNTTRFLIIGSHFAGPSGNDKTSLLINMPNVPGALASVIQIFAKNNLNLTLIESRPYRKHKWNYIFFLDVDGHQQEPAFQQAITELSQAAITFNIIGSYPKAIP